MATEATQSIWLVGSRANDDANEGSDWDLLMFSKNEPQENARKRSAGVDVIHIGPSGACLLEGRDRSYLRNFGNWQWREESTCAATYVSNDFLDANQEPSRTDRSNPSEFPSERACCGSGQNNRRARMTGLIQRLKMLNNLETTAAGDCPSVVTRNLNAATNSRRRNILFFRME